MIWEEVLLGDICEFIGGSQPAKSYFEYTSSNKNIRLIQIRDYKSDKNIVFIPLEKAKRFCKKSDVMIGRYGPPIFQILRGIEGAYNVALMKAVPKEGLDNDYLFYFLQNKELLNYVIAQSNRAAGQSGVKKDALEKYPLLLPSLEKQKRIVDKLDSNFSEIDKNISITKKQLNKLYFLDNSIKNKLLFSNSSTKKLHEVAEITMGQSPSGSSYNSEGNGFVLINGPVEFSEDPFGLTKNIKFTSSPTKFCQKDDALICVRGSTTGRMNIAREQACIGRGVASIRARENQKWINYFLRSSRNLIFSLGKGATFPNISQSQIRNLEVPYPSLKDQDDIIQNLDKLESSMSNLKGQKENKLDQLLALKESFLSKALKVNF